MNIVIDTNVFMSAPIKDSTTRNIIYHSEHQFLFPEFEFEEISKHFAEIMRKSGLSEPELNTLFLVLLRKVRVIRTKRVIRSRERAERIIGSIDQDDVLFIATALAFNCPIWGDDKHFKMQNEVRVFTTEELVKEFYSNS